jgi:predicted MFS family arabinose efflux permease
VLAAGLVLLGGPALALPAAADLAVVMSVCALRGVGLGILFIVCGELSVTLVPAERRGEGIGVIGFVAGLPAVIAMPLGVWLVNRTGFAAVVTIGALVALAGLVVVPGLPARRPEPEHSLGMLAGLRDPALVRPGIVFAGSAMAAGIVPTFLPAALPHAFGNLAAAGLLAHSVAATASRWWAGRFGDRHGAARLLAPGVLVAAVGVLALVLIASPLAVMAGMVLFGAGFGVVQNASMAMMYDRVTPAGYGAATAVWSVAYDAGLGLGAAGFGLVAAGIGYPAGFAVTAALMVVALIAARHPRR